MDTLPFKDVDSALEYVDRFFTSKKLTKNVQLLGKILEIKDNITPDGSNAYLIQISVMRGFLKSRLEKIVVLAKRHPDLKTELVVGDLVSWGAKDLNAKIPFGLILSVHELNLDISSGQFEEKSTRKTLTQVIEEMPKKDVLDAIELAHSMREYDIDNLYGRILPDCEFLVDGVHHYIHFRTTKKSITVCWNSETDEWSSGIDRKDLEGLSFSSPKLFEQVVFNLSSEENYRKKEKLNECLTCGIPLGQTKTVHAKLETNKMLELNFKSKEWNEILLGNTISFLNSVKSGKNEDGSDFFYEYDVHISDWRVVIHYEDPEDTWIDFDVFDDNIKSLKDYYS